MRLAIIAGGRGTRLGLQSIPKPMVLFGNKPLLEIQIELAKFYGINEVFILSGHLSEQIVKYFKDGSKYGLKISHLVEKEPLGTAGAIKQLEQFINEPFIVFYGDTLMNVDLNRFWSYSVEKENLVTVFIHPNDHPVDSDLVEVDDHNYVRHFIPKPHDKGRYYLNLVNAALYVLKPGIFKYIPENTFCDLVKDIFPKLLEYKEPILAYKSAEYIKDMGTGKRLEEATNDFLSGKIARLNFKNSRPAIFLDRDGVLNKEVRNLSEISYFELLPSVPEAIRKINKSDYLSIVITNQPVVAKGMCSIPQLNSIHMRMETLLGNQNAYIDHLYFCPHHPDKGFNGENIEYKIVCDCRKPGIGLLNAAKADYNIDIQNSFFIGDSTTDIQTAKNISIPSVLLRTGLGGMDGKFNVIPDFIFENLYESVEFIIDKIELLKNFFKQIYPYISETQSASNLHVISIGGLSRSGKTTISRYFEILLTCKGFKVRNISLDNWILSIDKRNESMTVRDRFQYEKIKLDLEDMFRNKTITINEYDCLNRSINNVEKAIDINGIDILIIDGLVALDIDFIRDISTVKLYVECDEKIRERRFYNLYKLKGLDDYEIKDLYQKRQLDENCIIRETENFSDFTIKL
jgi:histidinol-phosphate phosphatase family protein